MVGYELWPYITHIILKAVETNYMQNDRIGPKINIKVAFNHPPHKSFCPVPAIVKLSIQL